MCQGLLQDLSAEQPLEIQIRVLEVIAMLPEIHVTRMMSDTDLESKLLVFVNGVCSTDQPHGFIILLSCTADHCNGAYTRSHQLLHAGHPRNAGSCGSCRSSLLLPTSICCATIF